MRDETGWKTRGIAYVEFETEQDMQAALAKHGDVGPIPCPASSSNVALIIRLFSYRQSMAHPCRSWCRTPRDQKGSVVVGDEVDGAVLASVADVEPVHSTEVTGSPRTSVRPLVEEDPTRIDLRMMRRTLRLL